MTVDRALRWADRQLLYALMIAAWALGAVPGQALGQTAEPPAGTSPPLGVTLQLRWQPQFQFAGYYAALWKGFYQDAGLAVTIRSGVTPDGTVLSPMKEVAEGRADFGIGAAGILTARDAGADLVILKSFFQTSPAALYVRETVPYQRLQDVTDLRVMLSPDPQINIVLLAMLKAQGLSEDSLHTLPWDRANLGAADAFVGHSMGTPLLMERQGIRVLSVKPRHYGVDFYGDTLFSSQAMAEDRPTVADAFAQASRRGWQYAIDHPDEVAARLATDFPMSLDEASAQEVNRYQIGRVIDLTGHPLVELGHVNATRWATMHQTLRDIGLVDGPFHSEQVIFDHLRLVEMRSDRLHTNLLGTLAFVAVLLFVVAIFAILLRQAVAARTRQLAESEERYRLLVDNLHGYAVVALDAQGRIVSWSQAAEAMSGYTAEEAIGQPAAFVYCPEDRQAGVPERRLEDARRDGRTEEETWRIAKNGHKIWVHSVISVVHDATGQPRGYATITRDLSEARAQQDRIMFQATLLNRVRAAVIATDQDRRVVYMNAYAEAIFLLPWRDAAGRRLDELDIVPDTTEDALGDSERREREVIARRRDGQTFPALCITSRAADSTGKRQTEIRVLHDLTDRKAIENALHHASNLALLGRMSASLVHEISQPMNVIRLTAEGGLLRLGRQALEVADTEKRLRTIADQASRLFDTIDLMQVFSRRDAAVAGQPLTQFDAATAATAVVEDVVDRFTVAQAVLEADLPPPPVLAAGQPRQFEQVLGNLLGNAAHAVASLPAGRERRVRLSLHPATEDDPGVRLDIDDSGPGIPSSQREAIFEPFYTTKPTGKGTGLGLYISLNLMRSMRGDLEVGDSPLGGARFSIHLQPATAETARAAEEARRGGHRQSTMSDLTPAPPATDTAGPHILVVDDEALALEEISRSLRDRDYTISTARSGTEALAVLQRYNGGEGVSASPPGKPIDAVVTDIRMPRGSGIDLIRRTGEDYPQVFTIVMTGQPLEDRRDLEELGGADAILRKPISLQDLDDRLRTLLGASGENGVPNG